jgi:nucleotide-binding universal stress UspA family protein
MTERTHRDRVLVGVDPSPHAALAVAWAAREAVDRGMPLHLVHALDLPNDGATVSLPAEFVAAGRAVSKVLLDRLADRARRAEPTVTVTTETSAFAAAATLIVLGGHRDLIVTGTRGHGGFAGLLLGSVSLRTAAHAHCPTIVVRGTVNDPPRNEIVLGVERDEDEAPIRFAFESCERLGAKLSVVRAWLSAPSYAGHFLTDEPANDAEHLDDVERLIAGVRARHADVDVTLRSVRGNAVPSLIDAARGARMIVIGAHRRRAPLSVGAGYVVQGLLSHSATPVAVVPVI